MDEDTHSQVEALTELLHTVNNMAHPEDAPEHIQIIVSTMLNLLAAMWQALYSWYLHIGAPNGTTPDDFNAWMKTMRMVSRLTPTKEK